MERSELFLLDADALVSTLKRKDAQVTGAARLRTRCAAKELGDLLRTIELPLYARCLHALASSLEAADLQARSAISPDHLDRLTQRLDTVFQTLRTVQPVQDDAAFTDPWLSALTGPPCDPTPCETPVVVSLEESSAEAMTSQTPVDAVQFQRASLDQARQLHASQAFTPLAAQPALELAVKELLVRSRLLASKLNHNRLRRPFSVAAEVWSEVEMAVASLPSAVLRAVSTAADAVRIDLEGVSIDDPLCIAAGDRLGLIGGRVDACDGGIVIRVPVDYWRPMALPVQQPEGWAAVYSLQAASLHDDTTPDPERQLPAGLLLRVGARDCLLPMGPQQAVGSSPRPVWRHLLPEPSVWPQPPGWRALGSDTAGCLMPLLVPGAEGQIAVLTAAQSR
jgi:hypothetical protein